MTAERAALLTAAQMRAIEEAAIQSGEVTGLELMERAGRGVVEAIFAEWPGLAAAPHRAVVLCGPGNNGGDGFVVARLLKGWGWEVDVWLAGDPDALAPDAAANHARWLAEGRVRRLPFGGAVPDADDPDAGGLREYDDAEVAIVVDALFGTGLTRPIEAGTAEHSVDVLSGRISGAEFWPLGGHKVVAVDIPSGLCADSGRVIGAQFASAAPADLTVTFHAAKRGHYLARGPAFCGRLRIVDIGLTDAHVRRAFSAGETGRKRRRALVTLADPRARAGAFTAPPIGGIIEKTPRGRQWAARSEEHKYSHGHALVLSGGPGRGGAARLAARGALRVGAGLVTLGCPPAALQENAAQLNAIMLRPLKEIGDLIEFLADERITAVCLGPALGRGERAQEQVTAVLAAERATVLDADALTLHEDDPVSLFYQLHERCVLTPHAGEFRRLFPDLAERLAAPATRGPAYSRVDAAREAAERAGCTVLLKGPDTVIASPGGACAINASVYDRAAPWLATAGSGDVLAGFIAGLLARGLAPQQAAEAGAWLHTECALAFGAGLIAEDLPEALPGVFRALAPGGPHG